MSTFEHIPQEPDRVAGWAIQYVFAGTVITIALCAFVVWLFLSGDLVGGGRTNPVMRDTLPPSTSFDSPPTPLELGRHAQALQLDQWQWAGKDHRYVLEPVDRAIDRYLQEQSQEQHR